jgi:hypothetical protein
VPLLVMIEKGKRRGVTQAAREETGHVNYAHKDSLRHPITITTYAVTHSELEL